MKDENALEDVRQGAVKWFDPGKGYGFVVDGEGVEYLLHVNVLRDFGVSSLPKETELRFSSSQGRGARVSRIVEVLAAEDAIGVEDLELAERERLVACAVKWYDSVKGFGFLLPLSGVDEAYLHDSVVRRSKVRDLTAGAAVIALVDSETNRPQVKCIFPWSERLQLRAAATS